MNKLMVMFIALNIVFPVIAMEQEGVIVITPEENKRFVMHAQMAVKYSGKAVEEKKFSENNALHVITNKYPELLKKADNDLLTMIKNEDLYSRIQEYEKLESTNSDIISARSALYCDGGNVELKNLLIKLREDLSNSMLEKKQPTYSRPQTGEVQTNARLAFMQRNENYPLDPEAIKDYIATFIYQYILARRTFAFPNKTDI